MPNARDKSIGEVFVGRSAEAARPGERRTEVMFETRRSVATPAEVRRLHGGQAALQRPDDGERPTCAMLPNAHGDASPSIGTHLPFSQRTLVVSSLSSTTRTMFPSVSRSTRFEPGFAASTCITIGAPASRGSTRAALWRCNSDREAARSSRALTSD